MAGLLEVSINMQGLTKEISATWCALATEF
jgi:hypothetical protein